VKYSYSTDVAVTLCPVMVALFNRYKEKCLGVD